MVEEPLAPELAGDAVRGLRRVELRLCPGLPTVSASSRPPSSPLAAFGQCDYESTHVHLDVTLEKDLSVLTGDFYHHRPLEYRQNLDWIAAMHRGEGRRQATANEIPVGKKRAQLIREWLSHRLCFSAARIAAR